VAIQPGTQPLGEIPAPVLQAKSEYDVPGGGTEFEFRTGFPMQGFVADVHLPYLDGIGILRAHVEYQPQEKKKRCAENRQLSGCASVTHDSSLDTTFCLNADTS